jgi:hypothetical protein
VLSPTHRADRTAAEEAAQVDLRNDGRAARVVRGDRRRLGRNREDQPGDEDVEVGDSDELCTDAHSANVRRLGHQGRGVPTPARAPSPLPPSGIQTSASPRLDLPAAWPPLRLALPRPTSLHPRHEASARPSWRVHKEARNSNRQLPQSCSCVHYLRLRATRRIVECACLYSALMILYIHLSLYPPR